MAAASARVGCTVDGRQSRVRVGVGALRKRGAVVRRLTLPCGQDKGGTGSGAPTPSSRHGALPQAPAVVAVAAKQAVARKNHQTHRGLRWARRNLIRRHQRVIVLSRRPKHRLSAWGCAVDVRTIHRYMRLPFSLLEPIFPCPRWEGLERHTSHRTRQRLFRDWTLPCN